MASFCFYCRCCSEQGKQAKGGSKQREKAEEEREKGRKKGSKGVVLCCVLCCACSILVGDRRQLKLLLQIHDDLRKISHNRQQLPFAALLFFVCSKAFSFSFSSCLPFVFIVAVQCDRFCSCLLLALVVCSFFSFAAHECPLPAFQE